MRVGEYMERLKAAGRSAGFEIGFYGQVEEWGLPVLERKSEGSLGHVYVSAGVHGDEPAACLAIVQLLRQGGFPDGLDCTILPMVNPVGLQARTRVNGAGIDLNRDYGDAPKAPETRAQLDWLKGRGFDLAICLHEDSDGEGFYLYSHFKDESLKVLETAALVHAAQVMPIDGRSEIDGFPAREGRVFPPKALLAADRNDLPEALHLYFQHGVEGVFTTETPSGWPVVDRIEAHVRATRAILETYLEKRVAGRWGTHRAG
jgi:protein MpaA